MKTLGTLPADIFSLFDSDVDHIVDEENLSLFVENIKNLMRQRLRKSETSTETLRFSTLGRPNRQAWYDAYPIEGTKEKLSGKTYMKFMYGHLIEEMILFLAKEAGHTVEKEQAEVSCDGVLGHIDAIIDGVVVDVKSASPYGFKKFKDGTVVGDDPFGYVPQLSGYSTLLTPNEDAAWVAFEKVSGDICISTLGKHTISHYPPGERIAELKEIVGMAEEPPRCYPDVEDGRSGNRKLGTPCSYCPHRHRCWPGLRTFLYSTGPRFLTNVSRLPDVPEVTSTVELEDG